MFCNYENYNLKNVSIKVCVTHPKLEIPVLAHVQLWQSKKHFNYYYLEAIASKTNKHFSDTPGMHLLMAPSQYLQLVCLKDFEDYAHTCLAMLGFIKCGSDSLNTGLTDNDFDTYYVDDTK
jgi:hypothetical protein